MLEYIGVFGSFTTANWRASQMGWAGGLLQVRCMIDDIPVLMLRTFPYPPLTAHGLHDLTGSCTPRILTSNTTYPHSNSTLSHHALDVGRSSVMTSDSNTFTSWSCRPHKTNDNRRTWLHRPTSLPFCKSATTPARKDHVDHFFFTHSEVA